MAITNSSNQDSSRPSAAPVTSQPAPFDWSRRFGGMVRLYGAEAVAGLPHAHVAVVGIGGVGSWAAEALARSAVGRITLIDLDVIVESNVNRQIHALEADFGRPKVDAMAQRIRSINPHCVVTPIEDFVTPENVATLVADRFQYVIDAIDQVRSKAAIIAHCRHAAIPLISAGGAGGRNDPRRVCVADLATTTHDPLLARVRASLRRDYDFPRDQKQPFGISAIFSSEPLRLPERDASCEPAKRYAGLSCAGFGSSVCVTAVFGLLAASEALRTIIGQRFSTIQR